MSASLDRLSDAALLARCRREPEAFGIVYDRHAQALLRLVASRCRDEDVALEIVQETFARALRHAPRYKARGDGSALPWLRTIARNLVHDWRRRGVVEERIRAELGLLEPRKDPAVEGQCVTDPNGRLKDALGLLPTSQREAVTARVLLSASYDEIATSAGVTPDAARVRVWRGLRTLRALLTPPRGKADA